MTKIKAINDTKRANNRLKPIVQMCEKVYKDPGWKRASRQFQLAFARLDRELTKADEQGSALHEALTVFQQVYENGGSLGKPYENVYDAVRRVQSQRWKRLAEKYGPIGHYFDNFGQIKPQYRISARKISQSQEEENPSSSIMSLIAILAMLLFWWLW